MAKTKTKDYMLRAHNNYVHKKNRMTVLAPAGTIDKIRQVESADVSLNAYICRLIDADLKKRLPVSDPSAQAGPGPDPQEETPDWFN